MIVAMKKAAVLMQSKDSQAALKEQRHDTSPDLAASAKDSGEVGLHLHPSRLGFGLRSSFGCNRRAALLTAVCFAVRDCRTVF